MPTSLSDVWTWDMWFVDDGTTYHAFYLKASKALDDPDRRHFYVTVGHATSNDLDNWQETRDALIASDPPAFDDFTTWTGSIVRDESGQWRMFYTGTTREENATVQRIGSASSDDLYHWTKDSTTAVCEADARWYEKYDGKSWPDEAWRDPWVFHKDGVWHMLITARSHTGDVDNRGVIAHAVSQDLKTWTVQPPLSEPGAGFGHLEVPQIVTIDGRHVLIFSSLQPELATTRRESGEKGGIWSVEAESITGPFDISKATRLTDESLYAGRLIQDREGAWRLIAFENYDTDGKFVGAMSDSMKVDWSDKGNLRVIGRTFPGIND